MSYELTCPVCRHHVFHGEDDREACHSCGWINDKSQLDDPDLAIGANPISLNEYKKRLLEWMLL